VNSRRGARWLGLALGAVGALAIALRLFGLRYGLPAIYNPDEVAIMDRALGFAKGDANPHNFLYPTLYFYVLFLWECLWFAVGRLTGVFASLAAFQREFFVDPSRVFLAGRLLTVLCGTLTIWATYRFATRLYGSATGLMAALFLAVAPIAVRDAHYVKHDVPVTLLIVLVHGQLAGLVVDANARRHRRRWLLAGALAGLAVSTHYYAVFLALPLAGAALLGGGPTEGWRDRLTALALAGTAAALAFFIASPFLLVEPGTAWRDVVANRQIVMDRAMAPGSGAFPSLWPYLQMLARDAVGWPVFVAGLIGVAAGLAHDWRRGGLVATFPIAFLLFVSNTVPASRYLNPVLPFLGVAAAWALTRLAAYAGRRAVVAGTLFGLVAAWPGFGASWRTDEFFRQPDTRTLAQTYIEREIPSGASFLLQPYSVPLRPSRAALVEALRAHLGSEARASIKFQIALALDPYPEPAYRMIYLGSGGLDVDKIYIAPAAFDGGVGLAPLRALAVTYVVLKRYNVADSSPSLRSLEAALDREGRLISTFSPYRADVEAGRRAAVAPFLHNTDARIDAALERPGPTIELWRIN
jgi:uncharacterized membrane protein